MQQSMKTVWCAAALSLCLAGGAGAQVSSINSAVVMPRVYNDDPTSNLTVVNNYPSLISFDDQSVDHNGQTGGFANRHVWDFSNDGGSTAYHFQNDDFFNVSMSVTLMGTVSPRKEAGYLLDTIGGQGQFILDTDAHEVVAFGGPLPFYAFPATFNSGDTVTLGMTYFLDSNGKRAIIYHANGMDSPAQEFGNLEQGIITGSTLGGYMQDQLDPNNPNNFATASFANISIVGVNAVPEPSAFAALGLGLLNAGLLLRRRRK